MITPFLIGLFIGIVTTIYLDWDYLKEQHKRIRQLHKELHK